MLCKVEKGKWRGGGGSVGVFSPSVRGRLSLEGWAESSESHNVPGLQMAWHCCRVRLALLPRLYHSHGTVLSLCLRMTSQLTKRDLEGGGRGKAVKIPRLKWGRQ